MGVEKSLFYPHCLEANPLQLFLTSCRSDSEAILLVEMTMPLLSAHMKSAIIPDLIDLSRLLMLIIYILASLMYLLAAFLLKVL